MVGVCSNHHRGDSLVAGANSCHGERAKPLFYIDAPSGLFCELWFKALKGRNSRKGVQPLSFEGGTVIDD